MSDTVDQERRSGGDRAAGTRHAMGALPFARRPALDGVRAVAALLVVLFHSGVPFVANGYVGVDVFFVLSGFLITSLLVREIDVRRRVDLVAFYARRARRLLPAALLVLFVTAVLYDLLASPLDVAESRGGFVAAALYVSNWFFLAQSQDYFAADAAPSPVLHYWSLSVEEQFYLVWPVLLLVLFLVSLGSGRALRVAVAGLAVAGLLYTGLLAQQEPMQAYFGTVARAYQLMLGAVIALWVFRRQQRAHAPRAGTPSSLDRMAGQLLTAVGLAFVLGAASPLMGELSVVGRGALCCVATATLIVGMEYAPAAAVARVLSWSPARRLGDYSYAMYLWHWPVIVVGGLAGVIPSAWLPRAVIVLGLTIGLAAMTWRWVEQPVQRISLSGRTLRRRLAASGPVAALISAAALILLLPVSSTAADLIQMTANEPQLARSATQVEAAGSRTAGAPTVLLVGDSHSGIWFEAFSLSAQQQGWRVINVRRAGCAWRQVPPGPSGAPVSPCQQFRVEALRIAAAERPALTVLVSRSLFDHPTSSERENAQPGESEWLDQVQQGTQQFLSQLRAVAPKVVIFEPIPETTVSMNECLSTDAPPDSCSQQGVDPPGAAIVEAYWRTLAQEPGIVTVDLDALVCPGGLCQAMVGGIPTHRDSQHLTGAYAGRLMPGLEALLAAQGVDLARGTMTDVDPVAAG